VALFLTHASLANFSFFFALQPITGNKRLHALLEYGTGNNDQQSPSFDLSHSIQKSRYGLGDRRTLDQLINFSGIDTRNKRMTGNFCGNLNWVPFEEDSRGVDYIRSYGGINNNEFEVFHEPEPETHTKTHHDAAAEEDHHGDIMPGHVDTIDNVALSTTTTSNMFFSMYALQLGFMAVFVLVMLSRVARSGGKRKGRKGRASKLVRDPEGKSFV